MPQRQVWISDALREGLLTPDALTRALAEHEELQRQGQQITLQALLRARYVSPTARSRFESLVREATRQQTAVVAATPGSTPPSSGPPADEAATVTRPGSRPQGPSPESETRPRAAPRPSTQPTSLGRYEIAEEIARGGMGVVYRAHDPQLGRDVALKLLLDDSPARRKRFQVEARAISRLEHPNVIPIHEVGESPDGQPYLVMKLFTGGTLEDRLEADGPRPAHEAARTVQLLAQALHCAHDHMILHRDVKPANVLLGEDGAPVLTDFGLAKLIDSEASGATRSGVMLGTPSYMPPEQATGTFVDWRADVYALGATLYALLTGEPPFAADTTLELMVQIAEREPARPSSLRTGLPFDLDTICLKCLEKDPADRYPSAYALALDLGRFLEHQPIHAAPPSLLARVKKWRRRNTTLVRVGGVAAGLVFAISLGAAGWASHARTAERQAAVADARQQALAHAEAVHALRRRGLGDEGDGVGKALAALQAAQAWSALAPDDPAARQTHFDAALTLGDAAKAREQWVLAGEAYLSATALGIDDARARELAAEAEEVATRIAQERAAEVEGWLDRLAAGDLHRVKQGLLEAEFAIVRYADDQTVELLAERLDGVSDRLLEAAAAVFRELAKADPHEHAAGEQDLADCELALRLRALPPWDERDLSETKRAEAFFRAAYRRAVARATREDPHRPAALVGKTLVDQRIATRLGHGPLDLAQVCANVLGRIGALDDHRFVGVDPEPLLLEDGTPQGTETREGADVVVEEDSQGDGPPTSVGHTQPGLASDGLLPANTDEARSRAEEALLRYLFVETDPERALYPAMALIRLDPARSQRPFRQWQQRSPTFRRELRSFARNFRPRPAKGFAEAPLWGGGPVLASEPFQEARQRPVAAPTPTRQSADDREHGNRAQEHPPVPAPDDAQGEEPQPEAADADEAPEERAALPSNASSPDPTANR